jgi:hypothetical protein
VSARFTIVLGILFVSAAAVQADDDLVHVTTVNREAPYVGRLSRVDADATFHVSLSSGDVVAVPGRQIVTVAFPSALASRGPVRLDLVGGDVLYGSIKEEDESGIVLDGTAFARVTVPLERVRVLQIPAALKGLEEKPLMVASGGKDVVFRRLKNNVDRVQGTVDLVGPEGVTLETSLGELPFPFSSLVAVAFATPDKSGPVAGLHAVVLGADGSRVTGVLRGMQGGRLALDTPHGFTAEIALPRIKTLYCRGGDFVFVSDLTPAKVEERSFFPGVLWRHRRDRTTLGNPLRLGGVEYVKGLGVHAYCALTYPLDGQFRRFQALLGIDDEVRDLNAKGAVVFRVLLDGKQAYESPLVRGLEPPQRLSNLDVTGARQLTLIVDFGDESHAGDRADWAMALLVR